MPHDEINELKILIAQLGGQLSSLTEMVKQIKECQEKERDKASANSERITILEQQLGTAKNDIDKNFDQHKDFYKVQDKMERIEGMGVMLRIMTGGSIIAVIGVILTAIKVFGG